MVMFCILEVMNLNLTCRLTILTRVSRGVQSATKAKNEHLMRVAENFLCILDLG